MFYAFGFERVGVVMGELYFVDPNPLPGQEGAERGVRLEVRLIEPGELKGSIYSNGTIVFSSSALCGPPSVPVSKVCTGTWNPDTGNLTLVALNTANASKAIDMSGSSQVYFTHDATTPRRTSCS